MTVLVDNYILSPLSGLWSSLERWFLMGGYKRAAVELARQGYHTQAKRCMLELKKL